MNLFYDIYLAALRHAKMFYVYKLKIKGVFQYHYLQVSFV